MGVLQENDVFEVSTTDKLLVVDLHVPPLIMLQGNDQGTLAPPLPPPAEGLGSQGSEGIELSGFYFSFCLQKKYAS